VAAAARLLRLAVFGTNSEANSMSVEEKLELLDALRSGGVPPGVLMPGTGHCALSDSVKMTREAVRMGCGGVLMLPPFYYKGVSDDGLFRSFAEVIERVGDERLRLYLYHIPPVSNVAITLGLIEQLLARYPGTVAGVKDSSGDWSNTKAMLDQFKDRSFDVFAGSEVFLLDNMRGGGKGCITATGNVNPGAIDQVYRNWRGPRPTSSGRHHRHAQDRAEAADDSRAEGDHRALRQRRAVEGRAPAARRADRRAGAAADHRSEGCGIRDARARGLIRAIAENLQAWLETRFAVRVPIVERADANGERAIVLRRLRRRRVLRRQHDRGRPCARGLPPARQRQSARDQVQRFGAPGIRAMRFVGCRNRRRPGSRARRVGRALRSKPAQRARSTTT
jgi:4-hydroxy-tetrahydrodipicolinate synthase